ncbi:MAG: PQQ-binding-like beta-propeller repeat protein [Acidobacteria bacterium]|nr:PQQ-binding-like beta-propeller repeat protein [Acidobacteriota bacterium]
MNSKNFEMSRRLFLKNAGSAGLLLAVPRLALGQEQINPGPADWTRYGYDLRNTRFNIKEKMLGRNNVDRLKVKWSSAPVGPIQTCPAVIGDHLFFGSWENELRSLDARSGELKWKFSSPTHEKLKANAQGIRASAHYEQGRVYFADSYTVVHSVDALSGKAVWQTQLDEKAEINLSQTRHSPSVFRGKVIAGHAGGHPQIACLDAATGKVLWRFYTGIGGALWTSPAIDESQNIVYNVTGSVKGFLPSDPMLYTESILAHDLDSGELLWFKQAEPADPFDLDFSCHPMIFDAHSRRGSVRQCVAAGNKRGVYCYDRYTGELFWKTGLTAPSQNGGPEVDSTAVAYNRVYVTSNAFSMGRPMTSVSACLNAYNGEIEWWVHNAYGISCAVAVANGVFYQGMVDGTLQALDAETGKLLWEHRLPSACRGGIAVANGMIFAPHGEPMTAITRSGGPLAGGYRVYAFSIDGQ